MEIGDRLRYIRKELGYTQREAAERADMQYQYLSNLENNRIPNPSLDTLQRLADAYGLGVDQLIGRGVLSLDANDLPQGLQELLEDPQWAEEITDDWIATLLRIEYRGVSLRSKRQFLEAYLYLRHLLDPR